MSVNIGSVKALRMIERCCEPLTEAPLDAEGATRMAEGFKVLADPARLRLLSLIAAYPGAEACVCELIDPIGLSQPTVSHHLKVLHDAGLLTRDKRGTWVYYRVDSERLAILRDALGVTAAV
jgi:ArsR family transcriptional regulator, arsenate/arsenite/antimonite-responsive transcriptional repressor